MLFTYLEETRRQPEEVRKRKAMIITISITSVIVCFYLLTLYLKYVGTQPKEESATRSERDSTAEVFNAANSFLGDTGQTEGSSQRNKQVPVEENGSIFKFN